MKKYAEPLATELKALGCEAYDWDGESRVYAGETLTDQGLARIAELVADLPNLRLSLNRSARDGRGAEEPTEAQQPAVSLRFTGGGVTDSGMTHLAELDQMERLEIRENEHITDAGLIHLGKMDGLKVLALSRTGVTNKGLPYLKGMKGIEKLSVEPLLVDMEQVPELHDVLMAASSDLRGTVQVWDVATGRVRYMCSALNSSSLPLMFSADGTVAAVVEDPRGSCSSTRGPAPCCANEPGDLDEEDPDFSTYRAAFSPDGRRIAVVRGKGNRYDVR